MIDLMIFMISSLIATSETLGRGCGKWVSEPAACHRVVPCPFSCQWGTEGLPILVLTLLPQPPAIWHCSAGKQKLYFCFLLSFCMKGKLKLKSKLWLLANKLVLKIMPWLYIVYTVIIVLLLHYLLQSTVLKQCVVMMNYAIHIQYCIGILSIPYIASLPSCTTYSLLHIK